MNIGQILRGMMGDMQAADPKTLELRIGQIVTGVVLQMLGEQDALVKIGDVQVRAKLEAPLTQGQVTMLQVQPETTGSQIVLKPLQSAAPITENTVSALLRDFGLKATATNRQLVQLLHKEGIPLQQEQVRAFADLAKAAPASVVQENWQQASIIAIRKGLPLSRETVQALHQVMFGKPPMALLQDLKSQIARYMPSGHGNEPLSVSAGEKGGIPALLLQQVQETVNRLQTSANPIEWGQPAAFKEAKVGFQQSLQRAVMPQQLSSGGQQTNIVTEEVNNSNKVNNEAVKTHSTQSSHSTQSASLQGEKGNLPVVRMPNTLGSSLPVLEEKLVNGTKQPIIDRPLPEQAALSTESKPEPPTRATISNPRDAGGILEILKTLGLDYEHNILTALNKTKNSLPSMQPETLVSASTLDSELKNMDNFKAMLLQISESDAVPPVMKETAQQLIQQLTGQQLFMMSDRTQLFSHVTLFLPLQFSSGEQAAVIHIQSRKGKRGGLDAQNCRLLFDLHMKSLGETIVDVQVVKRMVSLQIHNDHPQISALLNSAKEEISASLNKVGYQLITMKTVPFPQVQSADPNRGQGANALHTAAYSPKPYKGVDMRI